MEKTDNYSEFTDDRYLSIYKNIFDKQKNNIAQYIVTARHPEKAFELGKMLHLLQETFKIDELLQEAIDHFNILFSLSYDVPAMMKSIEPIRLRMLEKFLADKTAPVKPLKRKVTKRFKRLGIPFYPKEVEFYNEQGELVKRTTYYFNNTWENWKALGQAKNEGEKFQAKINLYGIESEVHEKALEFTTTISGEPTRKRLFQFIAKSNAIKDFITDIKSSEPEKYKEFLKHSEENNKQDKVLKQTNPVENELEVEMDEFVLSSRKRQAIAYYYLLTAGNVERFLLQKADLARFIAFMSGERDSQNIINSSYYSATKSIFAKKDDYSHQDLEAIIRVFKKMKSTEDDIFAKALARIEKDKET